MLNSKEILKRANIVPKLRLATKKEGGGVMGTGAHRVKILRDKISKDIDPETGKERHIMIYYFDENGEERMYKVPMHNKAGTEPHYLVQRLSEFEEGEELVLEYKRKGMRGYIDVARVSSMASEDDPEPEDEEVIDIGPEDSPFPQGEEDKEYLG